MAYKCLLCGHVSNVPGVSHCNRRDNYAVKATGTQQVCGFDTNRWKELSEGESQQAAQGSLFGSGILVAAVIALLIVLKVLHVF